MNRLLAPSVALSALLLPACSEDAAASIDPSLIHTVQRGDLEIRVREQGELEAANNETVVSTVEGSARLIYLIPQGTEVKKGEKLAELDVSSMREKRALQAISVAKADAALEQAKKKLDILEKETRVAENSARSRLEIAKLRAEKLLGHSRVANTTVDKTEGTNAEMVAKLSELVETEPKDKSGKLKYAHLLTSVDKLLGDKANRTLQMGEMANQILQVVDAISLARVDLKLAAETLDHSRRLVKQEFITKNELEKDQINYTRQLSKVTLAWNNLQLLIEYTLPEMKIEREQEVQNAELGLQNVLATNEASRVRDRADLASTKAEYELAKERLDSLDQQITNSIVLAPEQGEVVYAYSRRRRGWVREGTDIDERQTIVYLPDLREMMARVMIHEAQISKVTVGQKADVRVDALPGEILSGVVTKVSTLPDASARYGNRNLKLYKVFVRVQRNNDDRALRTAMTTSVDIRCGVLPNVLHIPIIALHRRGNDSYVFKVTPDGPKPVAVAFGASNLTRVEIVEGLTVGDQIYLIRPPGVQLPKTAPANPDGAVPATGTDTKSTGTVEAGATK